MKPSGNHDQNTVYKLAQHSRPILQHFLSQWKSDSSVASAQQPASTNKAAFVNRRCKAGVRKSLYGRILTVEVDMAALLVTGAGVVPTGAVAEFVDMLLLKRKIVLPSGFEGRAKVPSL